MIPIHLNYPIHFYITDGVITDVSPYEEMFLSCAIVDRYKARSALILKTFMVSGIISMHVHHWRITLSSLMMSPELSAALEPLRSELEDAIQP